MTKVLLVEDDNNLREIYEARLAAEGYDIVTAKDGEDALAVAKQNNPDLIISDVMMPRISGFEMLDILRNTEGLKHAKVIMLTALGQSEDKTRADSLGADRYLVKSQVTLEDIVKAAEELLNPDFEEESAEPAASAESAPTPQPEASTPAEPVSPLPETPSPMPSIASTEPVAAEPTHDLALPSVQPEPAAPQAAPTPVPTPTSDPVLPVAQPAAEPIAPPTPVPDPMFAQTPPAQPAAEPAVSQPMPEPVTPQPIATPPADATSDSTTPVPTPATDSTEPHITITPPSDTAAPAIDSVAPQPEPAPAIENTPQATSDPVVPDGFIQPGAAQQPSNEPFITAPAPTSQPDIPQVSQPSEQPAAQPGISVIESPDLGVQAPAPGATEEDEPKIQMPHSAEDIQASVGDTQSVSEEQEAVEEQIDDFLNTHQDATPPVEVNPAEATATPTQPAATVAPETPTEAPSTPQNESREDLIESAMNELNASETIPQSVSPVAPTIDVPQPQPAPEPQVAAPTPQPEQSQVPVPNQAVTQAPSNFNGGPQIPGKKVIQPISAPEQRANINDLLNQEEIKENLAKGITANPVVAETPQPASAPQAPAPGVTPIAPQQQPTTQQPGGVFTPNSNGNADTSAL